MQSSWRPDYGTIGKDIPAWATQKPIRIALLGDFSASANREHLSIGTHLGQRKAIPVEFDTLEDALARWDVNLHLSIANEHQAQIPISELESFHPDALYRSTPLFAQLRALRQQLNTPSTFDKAAAQILSWSGQKKRKASQTNKGKRANGSSLCASAKLSDFARLTGADRLSSNADDTTSALIERLVAPFVVAAPNPQKAALLGTLDQALADAMRTVLHHPDFQATEALWRGVDWLLRQLDTGPHLQIHLIDVHAQELAADLSSVDDLSESGLYQLLVERPAQEKNGGYTYVAGLYQFEATPPHTELLGRLAKIAQHAGASLLTGINIEGLQDRKKPPHPLVQEAFKALQTLPEARHLALFGPRFMLRHPYGQRTDPISSFDFEEFNAQTGLSSMLWAHPALAALCALVGTGGNSIKDLAFHYFKDADGDTIALPCTDKLIKQDQASALHAWGINALMAHKGAPELHMAWIDSVTGEALGKTKAPSNPVRSTISTSINVTSTAKASPRGEAAAVRSSEDAQEDDFLSSIDNDDNDFGLNLDDSSDGDLDDLDALLSGLDSAADSSSDDDDSAGMDDIDPELAALLASLD